jgi:hypothetical protein
MRKLILLIGLALITVSLYAQYDEIETGWVSDIRNWNGEVVATVNMWEIMMLRPIDYNFNPEDPRKFDLTVRFKNGNTIVFHDMKDLYLRRNTEPLSGPRVKSDWDWEKTFAFGGASYGILCIENEFRIDSYPEYLFIVNKQKVISYDVENNIEVVSSIEDISTEDFWNNEGKLAVAHIMGKYNLAMSYSVVRADGGINIIFRYAYQGRGNVVNSSSFSFNNNTNVIPTTIIQNGDGSVTMTYTNRQGIKREHTFTTQ